jgi:hypothetical protein
MHPGRSCRGFTSKLYSFSCFRYNFHQPGFGGVMTGPGKAADNFLDGPGPLEFGDKRLQGIIVFGRDYIFEDLMELRFHSCECPRGTLAYVAVGIAEGAQQDTDFADVFDLSQRHYSTETNKPFGIGG